MRLDARSSIRWARMPAGLWHYTCTHHVEAIDRDGFLRPAAEGFTRRGLDLAAASSDPRFVAATAAAVWMTDLPDITPRTATRVGLTSATLTCDRTGTRYRVNPDTPGGLILSFREWVQAGGIHPAYAVRLASLPGAEPDHWYVSIHRIPILPRRPSA